MDKLRNSTREALRPSHALFPLELKRSLEETKRPGFFKNAYRNVRKAYFDRRTTQSEFSLKLIFSAIEVSCVVEDNEVRSEEHGI